jgi:toxin ParE1/3/4
VKLRWLRSGTRSLRLVHARIALDNPEAARAVVERIESAIAHLSAFPLSGRAGHVEGTRELIIPGLPYIVIYRVGAEFVEILRVFHASQDISAQLQ